MPPIPDSGMRPALLPRVLAAALAVAGLAAACDPPEAKAMVLKAVDLAHTTLTPKQKAILDRVSAAPETVGAVLVCGLGAKLTEGLEEPLSLPLPGKRPALEMKGYSIQCGQGKTCSFQWKQSKESATLTFAGKSGHGLIYFKDQVFQLAPLGDGLHVISQVDQSKLQDEPPAKKN